MLTGTAVTRHSQTRGRLRSTVNPCRFGLTSGLGTERSDAVAVIRCVRTAAARSESPTASSHRSAVHGGRRRARGTVTSLDGVPRRTTRPSGGSGRTSDVALPPPFHRPARSCMMPRRIVSRNAAHDRGGPSITDRLPAGVSAAPATSTIGPSLAVRMPLNATMAARGLASASFARLAAPVLGARRRLIGGERSRLREGSPSGRSASPFHRTTSRSAPTWPLSR